MTAVGGRLRFLWRASNGQRCRILLSCVAGVVNVGFSLAFIYVSKRVIDIATGTTPGSFEYVSIVAAVLLLLQLITGSLDLWLGNRMQVDTANRLRSRLFRHLLYSRWNSVEQFHTGDVMNRIGQDTATIVGLLTATVPALVVTSMQLLGAFVFFCTLDPWLPWVLVAVLPLFLFAGRLYTQRMQAYVSNIRRSDSHIQSVIQESLQHRTTLQTLEQSHRPAEQLDTLQNHLSAQVMDRTRFSLLTRTGLGALFSGSYLVAFLYGALRLSTGSITFGSMTALLQLVGKVQRPALDLSRLLPTLANALTAADRLMELEALPTEEDSWGKAVTGGSPSGEKLAEEGSAEASAGTSQFFAETPHVCLTNVSYAYPGLAAPVINNLSVDITPGSHVAILGSTGAGKTTLFRLLLGLIQPQQGEIALYCNNRHRLIAPGTRCNFVYVPQGNTLLSGTIRDNLLMGNPHATTAQLEQALRIAVAHFVFALPQGIDTPLHEQGAGLSEGQAQRLAIARALLRPGRILLFDEATSALDADTAHALLNNLRRDCLGKTCLFITHHAALAEACEKRIQL